MYIKNPNRTNTTRKKYSIHMSGANDFAPDSETAKHPFVSHTTRPYPHRAPTLFPPTSVGHRSEERRRGVGGASEGKYNGTRGKIIFNTLII